MSSRLLLSHNQVYHTDRENAGPNGSVPGSRLIITGAVLFGAAVLISVQLLHPQPATDLHATTLQTPSHLAPSMSIPSRLQPTSSLRSSLAAGQPPAHPFPIATQPATGGSRGEMGANNTIAMLACTLAGLAFAGLLQKLKGSTLTPPQTTIGSIHQHAMFATAGEFQLPALPWERGALAPFISAETIDYHYGKHHQAYVTKLNELLGLPENAQFRGKTLEELVLATTGPMFNQAAQIWNHTFYWNGLRPNPEGRPNPAGGAVAALIERDFGSFAAFQEQFTAACVGHFGSGWVWLVYGADGRLRITQGHDAANPVRDGTGAPLLTCDVWEHAYYIDQRNARPAYVKAWWSLVNWDFVNGNLPARVA